MGPNQTVTTTPRRRGGASSRPPGAKSGCHSQVAAWHGHTERMTQAVYGRVTDDRLTAAADVFSRVRTQGVKRLDPANERNPLRRWSERVFNVELRVELRGLEPQD